jgi:hypothetical protein
MRGWKALGFLLLKNNKEYVLISIFWLSDSSSINHSKLASILDKQGRYENIHQYYYSTNCCSCYAMWQKYQVVSISARNGRSWNEFHNLARDPNSHDRKLSFPGNRSHLILGVDHGHHKRLQDHTHIQCAGRMSTARLYDRTPVCYAECIPTCRCVCATRPKIRVVR